MSSNAITGVVLAGGKGTRLYPLTEDTSKQLLPIGELKLIEQVILQLVRAGIVDIVMVIDERCASEFMTLLHDGSALGLQSLTYVWQPSDGKGLPTAIQKAEHAIKTEKFVVVCGDVLLEGSIKNAVDEFLRQEDGARLIGMETEDTAGYTKLRTDGDQITGLEKKNPNNHIPGHIDLGFYFYDSSVFQKIHELSPSARQETEIWDLNAQYIASGNLQVTKMTGWWSDVGSSLEEYKQVDMRYSKESVEVLILGAGMAGLGAGIQASREGKESLIIEAADAPGGLCRSTTVSGCDFDFGPKVLLLDDPKESEDILSFLGDNAQRYPLAETVYLSDYGLLSFPLQRHLNELPQELRDTILAEIKGKHENPVAVKSYKEWLISQYGETLSNNVLIPYEEKKWQTSLDNLDYKWALSRPVKVSLSDVVDGSTRSLPPDRHYYYPKRGNISELSNSMAQAAGKILLGTKVTHINLTGKYVEAGGKRIYFKTLISTLPLDKFVEMTDEIDQSLKEQSRQMLTWLSINVYNFVFKGNFDLEGTATYYPDKEFVFRRVSILENLCPALGRDGKTAISVEVSLGDKNQEAMQDEATGAERVLRELRGIVQFSQLTDLIDYEVLRIPQAYPLQVRNLKDFVNILHKVYEGYNIFHCGRGGNFDYCNSDIAYKQGKETLLRSLHLSNTSSGVPTTQP